MKGEELTEESGFNATFISDSPKFRRRRGLHSSGGKSARPKLPAEFGVSSVYKSDNDPKLLLKKGVRERIHPRSETKKSRPKLPDAFQAGEIYRKEIDSASHKPPIAERIKKMVRDEEQLNDDERHRQLINRLSNRIKRSAARLEEFSVRTEDSEIVSGVNDDDDVAKDDLKVDAVPEVKQSKEVVKSTEPEEPRSAMELDDPPIPTMRRRMPPRSDLVTLFSSKSIDTETSKTSQPDAVSSIKPHTDFTHKTTVYTASDNTPLKVIPKSVVSTTSAETTRDITEENHSGASMLTRVVAACVVVCFMSVLIYFAFM